jgi:GNAT superfamily N-acetyltransferase
MRWPFNSVFDRAVVEALKVLMTAALPRSALSPHSDEIDGQCDSRICARSIQKCVEISEPQLQYFFFVETAEAPAALKGGAEIDGEYTLPRSFAVDAGQRKARLGSLLVARLEYHTRERGARQTFLLTTTAWDCLMPGSQRRLSRDYGRS